MAIAVQCGSCQVKINAPDHMAGKKGKCPKCGQAIIVPAGLVPVAHGPPPAPAFPPISAPVPPPASAFHQPSPPVPPPTPAFQPPVPPASGGAIVPVPNQLPLLSFDDLKVPARLRRSIETEVGGEPMVWLGRPTPQSLLSKAMIGMWVGLGLTILILIGMVAGLVLSRGTVAILIVVGIGALMLLSMGLPLATMPWWVKKLINFRDCYVLTPTRAIVFDNEKILWARAKPHTASELQQRALQVNADGTGSIIFRYEDIDLGTRTTERIERKDTVHGKQITFTTTTRQQSGSKAVGFMDVENVEAVDAMLRQVLGLGPPASKNVH